MRPDYRGHRVGSLLIEARFDLIRRRNLRGLVAGSLIVGYGAVADHVSVEQYVRDVVEGKRFDSNLSKQLHKGFEAHGLIPNYSNDDQSLGWGVEIVWHNPDYRRAPSIFVLPAYRRSPAAAVRPVLSHQPA